MTYKRSKFSRNVRFLPVITTSCRIITYRLASSEESRLVESFQALVAKLNTMALTKFHKEIETEKEAIASQRGVRSDPEHFYNNCFLKKVSASSQSVVAGSWCHVSYQLPLCCSAGLGCGV